MADGVVLVTGGSRGIGDGISRMLGGEGYRVVVLDRVEPESGAGVEFHSVDLMDADATREALRRVTAAHEVTRLVNNVGIVRPAPAEETTIEDFADVVNLNARAALLCVQAVLPAMRRARSGRIVSVTSRVVLGKELRTAYSASKGALAAMTRTWALEFAADGITVNAVAPGPIGTAEFSRNNPPDSQRTRDIVDHVPVGRLGTPDDVAHAVRFFLDPLSGFVTGQTLYVCGGLTVGLAAAP
jgi:NAD(P)-dependent dehydrogenase (short-subunit alcohol dehydrogenase family)